MAPTLRGLHATVVGPDDGDGGLLRAGVKGAHRVEHSRVVQFVTDLLNPVMHYKAV